MSIFSLEFFVAFALAGIATMTDAFERGDVEEASRQGVLAGPAIVEEAMRAPARTTKLAAIASAPYVEARPELLPALAQLASSADRRVAIPAAQAARTIARQLAMHELPDDIAEDDVLTWRALFDQIAQADARFIEVRVLALDTVASLAQTIAPSNIGFDLSRALDDPDPAFRAAAVALVPRPTPEPMHAPLADAVKNDANPKVALGAAQALCGDDPIPAFALLGAGGVDRIKRLVAGKPARTVRDASRCLKR